MLKKRERERKGKCGMKIAGRSCNGTDMFLDKLCLMCIWYFNTHSVLPRVGIRGLGWFSRTGGKKNDAESETLALVKHGLVKTSWLGGAVVQSGRDLANGCFDRRREELEQLGGVGAILLGAVWGSPQLISPSCPVSRASRGLWASESKGCGSRLEGR